MNIKIWLSFVFLLLTACISFALDGADLEKAKVLDQFVSSWDQQKDFGRSLKDLKIDEIQKSELRKIWKKEGVLNKKLPELKYSRDYNILRITEGEFSETVLLVDINPVTLYVNKKGVVVDPEESLAELYLKLQKKIQVGEFNFEIHDGSIWDLFLPRAEAKKKSGTNWWILGPSLLLIAGGIGTVAYMSYREKKSKEVTAPSTGTQNADTVSSKPVEKRVTKEPVQPVTPPVDHLATEKHLDEVGAIEAEINKIQSDSGSELAKFICKEDGAILSFQFVGQKPLLRFSLNSPNLSWVGIQEEKKDACIFDYANGTEPSVVNTKVSNQRTSDPKKCNPWISKIPSVAHSESATNLMTKLGTCCHDVVCRNAITKTLDERASKAPQPDKQTTTGNDSPSGTK